MEVVPGDRKSALNSIFNGRLNSKTPGLFGGGAGFDSSSLFGGHATPGGGSEKRRALT